jgi:hypothetical protein
MRTDDRFYHGQFLTNNDIKSIWEMLNHIAEDPGYSETQETFDLQPEDSDGAAFGNLGIGEDSDEDDNITVPSSSQESKTKDAEPMDEGESPLTPGKYEEETQETEQQRLDREAQENATVGIDD